MAETATAGSVGRATDSSVAGDQQRPVDSARVSVGSRVVAYSEYGDPAGRPVVVLHGTPGSRRFGGLFAPAAADQGLRLLAVDRPGYGDSEAWPERSISDVGQVVTAVLDEAGIRRAGIVGFSGGGPHAMAVAATSSDRVTSVDVISGSTPPSAGETPALQRLLAGAAAAIPRLLGGLFGLQAWLAEHVSPVVFLSQYTDQPVDAFDECVVDHLSAEFVAAVGGRRSGVATEFRLLGEPWGFEVGAVDRPVRLWHGQQDNNVPLAGVRHFARQLPDGELLTVDGDHLTTLLDCRGRVLARHI